MIPKKHHYIPQFYLKRWRGEDGRLCEFSRPYGTTIKPRRVHPSQTGYLDRLYELRGLTSTQAQIVEDRFFKRADTDAADALFQLEGPHTSLDPRLRSGWTRFILSLLLRCPEDIECMRMRWRRDFVRTSDAEEASYQAVRIESAPETFSRFLEAQPEHIVEGAMFETFIHLVDNPEVGELVNKMRWFNLDFSDVKHTFLTSDRPIIHTNGWKRPESHIVMPIGPKRLFVAANSAEVIRNLMRVPKRDLMRECNDQLARGAVKYVYGVNDKSLKFVRERMSSKPQSRILHRLSTLP